MSEDKTSVISSPFIPSTVSVAQIMRMVIYALIPGIIVYIYTFGWGVLINIIIAILSALIFEWIMLVLRNRPIKVFLFDGSAIITAILLVLCIPPMVSWWIPVIGCFFAIVVAKHLYGGLGYNAFNPAMAAYAILLISFPMELSLWSSPLVMLELANGALSFIESIEYSVYGILPNNINFDAYTSATILDLVRTETGMGRNLPEISQSPIFGSIAGKGFELVNIGFLIGGLWLIYKKIISWHIPLALFAGISFIATLFYFINPLIYTNPLIQIFGGATILGAFFIATDPITASTTSLGKILYGFGIGLLIFSIRTWGGYPDGVAFAVLLIGLTVPLLDYYTTPKVFGVRKNYEKS